MIGLVYKDFLVQRKTLGYYLVLTAIYAVAATSGGMGMGVLGAMTMLVGVLLPTSAFAYDEQAKWDGYAAALPGGRRDMVRGRYLFALACVLGGCVLTVTAMGVVSLLGLGEDMPGILLAAVVCTGMALLIDCVLLPLLFRFGAEKSRIMMMVLFAVVFGGVVVLGKLLSTQVEAWEPAGAMTTVLPVLAILLLAAAAAVSYRISLRICTKKEY